MKTPPVLFIVFRRPDTTLRVFEAIRRARPGQLFVAADGPRPGRADEAELCLRTRAIIDTVDWPCEVKTLFQETNLGIKKGVSSAITWFFDQVDEGIILEDDCLPHPDFFEFCARLLDKYRADPRILHIGGVNFQPNTRTRAASYYFSRYNHVWGWATWKRAWERYRPEMEGLEDFLEEARRTAFWDSARERKYWEKTFRRTRDGVIVTWDYQWKYTLWAEGGVGLSPEANLVINLGFGEGATNTANRKANKGEKPLESLGEFRDNPWPLRHREADRFTFVHRYWGTPGTRVQLRFRQIWQRLRGRS